MNTIYRSTSVYSVMLALVVMPFGCAHEKTVAPTLSAPAESSASRENATKASDAEIAAGELIKAYEALSDGDVSAAAERFPDDIAWSVLERMCAP